MKIEFLICKFFLGCYIVWINSLRRDGRAVEGAALEMLFRRNLNASSNLALSAIYIFPVKRNKTRKAELCGSLFCFFGQKSLYKGFFI